MPKIWNKKNRLCLGFGRRGAPLKCATKSVMSFYVHLLKITKNYLRLCDLLSFNLTFKNKIMFIIIFCRLIRM